METQLLFELDFAKTYPDFIKNLGQVSDNLTSKEIKICMLIRMNFDSDYIQNHLNISRSTFLNARSSIRKKLGLKREQNLVLNLAKH
jgi:AraC family chitin signaling transcriptional activator